MKILHNSLESSRQVTDIVAEGQVDDREWIVFKETLKTLDVFWASNDDVWKVSRFRWRITLSELA